MMKQKSISLGSFDNCLDHDYLYQRKLMERKELKFSLINRNNRIIKLIRELRMTLSVKSQINAIWRSSKRCNSTNLSSFIDP